MSTYTRTSFLIVLPHEQKYTLVIKVSSHMPATRISLLYQRHKRPNKGIRGGFVVYLCRPSGRYRFLWSPKRPAGGEARGASAFSLFALALPTIISLSKSYGYFLAFLLRLAKFRKFGREELVFSDLSPRCVKSSPISHDR